MSIKPPATILLSPWCTEPRDVHGPGHIHTPNNSGLDRSHCYDTLSQRLCPNCPVSKVIDTVPDLTDIWLHILPQYLYYPCLHCNKVQVTGYSYCCDHCSRYGASECMEKSCPCSYDKKTSEGWKRMKRRMFPSHNGKAMITISDEEEEEEKDKVTDWCAKRVKVCNDEKCNRNHKEREREVLKVHLSHDITTLGIL